MIGTPTTNGAAASVAINENLVIQATGSFTIDGLIVSAALSCVRCLGLSKNLLACTPLPVCRRCLTHCIAVPPVLRRSLSASNASCSPAWFFLPSPCVLLVCWQTWGDHTTVDVAPGKTLTYGNVTFAQDVDRT